MLFSELQTITSCKSVKLIQDRLVLHLITDSRKVIQHEGSIFFAIAGQHHDGHRYVADLYRSGIRQFVIERDISLKDYPEANFLYVESTLKALQQIAATHRAKFSIPVIGVTGSNGKTIIKEWVYQLLSKDYTIVKNPGSYNSQLGVPLSVWQLQHYHTLAVFEAGISMPGEMENLSAIIKPTIGIFTNIGTAHNENFQSIKQKIEEKLNLFSSVNTLIFCADHPEIYQAVISSKLNFISWGFSEQASIRLIKHRDQHYEIRFGNVVFSLHLPFTDKASIENAFHCIALMLLLDIDPTVIQERIRSLQHIPMRLELKEGINQSQLIDDTYNNDLGGLQISLDFLNNQHQKKSKTLILSDILQSGLSEEELITNISQLVNRSGVNKFIGIGEVLFKHSTKFNTQEQSFYKSTADFLRQYNEAKFLNEIILIKGARAFQFEKIVSRLQRKVHGTVMEVDLGGLVHNLNYFKSRLKPTTKLMVMVKAFAYGSGSVEVANVLQYHRVDYLGVAYADEGVELRKNNIRIPIMVMNPTQEAFHAMTEFDLEPEMYGFTILNQFISFLDGESRKVHIKIDTGMHRLGFGEEDIEELINVLSVNTNLQVASIYTHLAGSDEAQHDDFSNQQVETFLHCATKISKALGYSPILHALNTPGILRLPQWQLDMVRLGVGLYGVDPTTDKHPLKVVATLKTVISQIKKLTIGESIGYGRRGVAKTPMTTATIAIGYADGYSRAFSRGVGEVYVNGHVVKVVGNVCMDMTMIDVTGIDVQEGDEIVIFGKEMPIEKVAESINTIPYEILTNTSSRVKRIFVAESI
jgi:Alr-MurF fusion protein